MKIAISIDDAVFKDVESLAKKLHCSRSEVFSTAVREFLEQEKSRHLLSALNAAYAPGETAEEKEVRERAKRAYASRARKEKY